MHQRRYLMQSKILKNGVLLKHLPSFMKTKNKSFIRVIKFDEISFKFGECLVLNKS